MEEADRTAEIIADAEKSYREKQGTRLLLFGCQVVPDSAIPWTAALQAPCPSPSLEGEEGGHEVTVM